MTLSPRLKSRRSQGFTLIELAVALFIIAIVLAGVLVPLNAQIQQKKISDTQRMLDEARDAVLGFVAANGRVPCPASAASNGFENPLGGGICTNPYDGFLPAASLGLTNTDNSGYAVDGWSTRIHYAVTTANAFSFTTIGQIKTIGMSTLTPDLHVCSTSTGIGGGNCGPAATLTSNAVAVIYSVGPNFATGGTGADEAQNPNPNGGSADNFFVYHIPTTTSAANGEFDDIVTWISPYIIYSRMINAGLLP